VTFQSPANERDNRDAPADTPGIRHLALAVDEIDTVVAGLRARGAELVGGLGRYEDSYRLCYVRAPGGIMVEGAERIGQRVESCLCSRVPARHPMRLAPSGRGLTLEEAVALALEGANA
jgi:hypothetical protein